jgi:hypothetical protein
MFKAYYIRKEFEQEIAKITGDHAIWLTEFWKNYNIRHAVENIHHAWQQSYSSGRYIYVFIGFNHVAF